MLLHGADKTHDELRQKNLYLKEANPHPFARKQ